MNLKISFYKALSAGSLMASFNVEFIDWGLTFYECKLFMKGASRWIDWGSKEYHDKEGKRSFKKMVAFTKEAEAPIKKTLLEMIDASKFTTIEQDLERIAAKHISNESQSEIPF